MEFFNIIMMSLSFILLLLGSITDFKKREVPDYLSHGMMFLGIGLRLLYSLFIWDWNYIISGLLGLGIFYIIAYALYYTGQWGGGDSKALMAMGALLGIEFVFPPFMLSFLMNLIVIGAVYGFCWGAYLAFTHKKEFVKAFFQRFTKKSFLFWRGLAFFLAVLLLIYAVFSPLKYFFIIIAPFILFSPYLFIFMKSVEECMFTKMPVSKLTEGDWIAEDVIVHGKKIYSPEKSGITKEQLQKIQKTKLKTVLVKEGIPFIPSFLISFIVTFFFGNLYLMLI